MTLCAGARRRSRSYAAGALFALALVPSLAGAETEAPPGIAAEAEEDPISHRWHEREEALRETGSISGGTGLLHMQHATGGEPGQLRLGLVGEGFSASFLCSASSPCVPRKAGGGTIHGDTMDHAGATIALGATLARLGPGVLEAHASTFWMSNADSADRTTVLQTSGDATLGLKYTARVASLFHAGFMAELMLINGTGTVGLDWGATSARFTGMGTVDLRELESPLPLRFSGSFGYILDNSADSVAATEGPIAQGGLGGPVTRIERFGLGVNRVDRLEFHLGAEALLLHDRVRPFVEYALSVPESRGGGQYACTPNSESHDLCLKDGLVLPSVLTVGSRVYPWNENFSITAGLDVGITGTNVFVAELAPIPPWTLYLGAGWAIDTEKRPLGGRTNVVERVVTATRSSAPIRGVVHEKEAGGPVAGAIVTYESHPDLNAQLTSSDGRFSSPDVPFGPVTISVTANGFRRATCRGEVANANAAAIDCPLEALPHGGTLVGHVKDAETNSPIAGVALQWVDVLNRAESVITDARGAYRIDNLPPSAGELHVVANSYVGTMVQATVVAQTETAREILLHQAKQAPAIRFVGNDISTARPVEFANDSAVILTQSYAVLSDLADMFTEQKRIRRFEVQGHTDNTGKPAHNKLLSAARAEAVRRWLSQHGVSAERMIAVGYGDERPIVANVSPENRALNCRIQFRILEQDPAPPKR